MIQTALAFLVFTIAAIWYSGHHPPATSPGRPVPLMTPRLYAGLFALALLLALLWR
ncbi:MAG TPA: hypothetical protein VM536_13375 [Chloroflexia bacterium]|nr:hypothetical protein [Chloroflexia bacterium]